MGTLFAGFLRVPMTSVFMVLEVSGNYSIIVPVLVSNTIAYLICRRFQPIPIFDIITRQDGLDLPSMEEDREQTAMRVENAMRKPFGPVLPADATIAEACDLVAEVPEDPLLVCYKTGRWSSVRKTALSDAVKNGKGALPLADLVAGTRLPRLHPDQSLDLALRLLRDAPYLPVVHRADARRLLGILSLEDVLAAYRRASESGGLSAD
jgi:CIC family chloride channel protein